MKIKEVFDERKEKLLFYTNNKVHYINTELVDPIVDFWKLDEINNILYTNLKLELPPQSGYSTKYFYPKTNVRVLTKDKLVLDSDTLYFYSFNDDVKHKIFTRYYFINYS